MQLHLADVAELADAQVSEACDGDIVEVQVLSSAPNKMKPEDASLLIRARFFRHIFRELCFSASVPW
jgi:hypothetical protein